VIRDVYFVARRPLASACVSSRCERTCCTHCAGHAVTVTIDRAADEANAILADELDRRGAGLDGLSRLLTAENRRLNPSLMALPAATSKALYLLERAAGFWREDTAEQRLDKLEAVLAQATGDPGGAAPLLASLLSIPTGARYPPLDLTPQKQKEKTLQALTAQVEKLAARQPVLMLFEDGIGATRPRSSCWI
jgi:hypothetical protein